MFQPVDDPDFALMFPVPHDQFAVLTAEEIRLLTALGFVAAGRGDVGRAERVFKGLRAVRPTRAFPYIGLAMAYMNVRRVDDALQVFNEAAQALGIPDTEDSTLKDERVELRAFRGLVLQLAGRHHESQLDLHASVAGQGPGATLARRMLGVDTSGMSPDRKDQS